MTFEFHPEARIEYFEAITYYEERQPGLGVRFTLEIESTIQRILDGPRQWREVEADVRRCLTHTFPYGLLYSIDEDRVFVLAVMHHSRKPGYWRNRNK